MSLCGDLHGMASRRERYSFPFDQERIPENGIYILFEKGETGHGGDRIVRVGTHTGKDMLWSRLREHFLNENKDRSIFRKNIGRALLNRAQDPFLDKWNHDRTTRRARLREANDSDSMQQERIEKNVSGYIRDHFSFVVFQVKEKTARLDLEAKLIALIHNCSECKASVNWLGRSSPIEKISQGKLWQVQHLSGNTAEQRDLAQLLDSLK